MNAKILATDDREGIRRFIKDVLDACGYQVDVAVDGKDAWKKMQQISYHLLITDLKMPIMDGMTLLKKVKEHHPSIPVIVLTAHGTIQNAVEAMKIGAADYLTKPLESPAALREIVQRHLSKATASLSLSSNSSQMVARDKTMGPVIEMLKKVAPTDTTVLLTGPSGTGKEVAAQQIHKNSQRQKSPFIAVNCAAISGQLMESDMFGHEKGAFTGATELKKGRFELADGGTLFLDEVGELPLSLQAKLLRVLQERVFERVGGNTPIHANVRIVAATNRNLLSEIETGRFREDLYHRLSVFPIQLPALNKRKSDIIPLAEHFLRQLSQKQNTPPLHLSAAAAERLREHDWPGNIRELSNTLERAAIMGTPPIIQTDDLFFASQSQETSSDSPGISQAGSLKEIEKEAILQTLKETDGHRKNAAQKLGIGLRTLYNKLKEYGIE